MGGVNWEAAPSDPELHASLGPALGITGISSNPKLHFSLKVADKTVTELTLRFFPLIMLFSDLCGQKTVAHNPEGLHL